MLNSAPDIHGIFEGLHRDWSIPAIGIPAGSDLPPTAEQSSAQQPGMATGPIAAARIPLIDFGQVRPDGTPHSLQGMLQAIGKHFEAQVFLGLGCQNTHAVYSSEPGTFRQTQPDALIKSAVIEASHTAGCLYATNAGHSSGVLSNVLKHQEAAVVLGFSVHTTPRAAQATPGAPATSRDAAGIVLSIRAAGNHSTEDYAQLIAQLRRELPDWLELWRLCRLGQRVKRWDTRVHFYRSRRGKIGLTVAACLLASLALPVPYWPRRKCTVEPASRQYLASPIGGRVARAEVRPGDLVSPGKLLATIDDEQLRWELSAAEADYESAAKRRQSALATRAGGEMRLAQLEQERIAIEIESLRRQLELLEIRSPCEGIVVQGDWTRNAGAPVERGDTLFEISPLDKMQIATELTTEDLAWIQVGDTATVRVDAAQGETWQGTLQRIDPRGQVVDSKVVFMAEMDVDNRNNALRPGMQGSVRLSAGTKSLGWLLFHRPYVWVMKKLAW
ncbi:MAG: efflux RND transporter periplasmic adaptor subunit [Pirellulaceae bacterium]